ncbi:Dihydrofolate synthase/folylpolyglutamate synthase [Austwickia sp. TVS 96-490-7B]|uniref:bifunctional folylpolyglutamate synthase/dihydrofolate synthase n=1 Tax=Austwickia sp. TVS 96-490-7B TaxID=2830843 RepID=UPI001C55C83B|nr:folylpolyglutamate synthase/dihydrofolate synthase family protein [Austwickia sp. TVS 96-490-7B]MBW3086505.1 Dihydrofolate synthase/folylpolyglutamate synthase [Austwickia sp. TVS 96-490-7B]
MTESARAQRQAARRAAEELATAQRMREVEQAILSRAPEHDLEPSLDRIAAVMELLGDPQRSWPMIHLTGTNGKTSTTRMTERLLREMGLSTGRFTSPHLHDIRERIALNGESITPERFVATFDDIAPYVEMVDARSAAADGPRMTYFELVVGLAYAAFADAPVDVAVVEVGMGGSWDATNVADAAVSVMTPIGLDHQHFLGHSLTEIATEKSGIIAADGIMVSAVQEGEVAEVLWERCREVGARAVFEGADIGVLSRTQALGGQVVSLRGLAGDYEDLFLPLHGGHQAHNALLALTAVEAFVGGGESMLDRDVVEQAFGRFTAPGRLEVVRRSPTVIVDAAHNPHGASRLRTALEEEFAFARLIGLVAVLGDKDAEGILTELEPVLDEVVVSRTTSPRAMRPERLGALAAEIFGEHRVTVVRDLPDAVEIAAAKADAAAEAGGSAGGVVATGSVTTAAEVRLMVGAGDAS